MSFQNEHVVEMVQYSHLWMTHLYWYAHIIGIYHTLVRHHISPDPIRLDLLRVRCYSLYGPDRQCRFSRKW